MNNPLSSDLIQMMDAYWRATNYLSVGQIYLYDNPAENSLGTGAREATIAPILALIHALYASLQVRSPPQVRRLRSVGTPALPTL